MPFAWDGTVSPPLGTIPPEIAARLNIGRASAYRLLSEKAVMERVFIGATRAEATRMADDWWAHQKGLRQTLRSEVVVAETVAGVKADYILIACN